MDADAAIAALTDEAELRTWSLIVTIFGDIARRPGAAIPGPVLSALTARIGVKPEAMRVALHRLRKDDWLVSQRDGRVSHYGLTDSGRAESERATARIYAATPPEPDHWHVAVAGPLDPPERLTLDAALTAAGYVTLAAGAWLGSGPAPADRRPGLFLLDGAAPILPHWLRASLMPPALAEAYARFDAALARAAFAGDAGALTPLDRAAIRVLVVHGWRRLVLRHPDLPDRFFPADWTGPSARRRVRDLLDRLGPASVVDIAEDVDASA